MNTKKIIKEQQTYMEFMDTQFELQEDELKAKDAHIDMLKQRDIQVVMVPTNAIFKNIDKTKMTLKDIYAYMVPLANETSFTDSPNQPFNRFALITRREYEKEFTFTTLRLFLDDGVDVNGQAAKCWFVRIGWIKFDLGESIPILYSIFTVKDVQFILDAVIDSTFITSIKEEVLGRMVLTLQNNYRKYQDIIDTAEDFRVKAEDREELLRKRVRTDLHRLDNQLEKQLTTTKIQLTKIQVLLLGLGWIIACISLGMLGGMKTGSG